jgi:murein DD-endopeptidase MepM/ murein hydrolase activator NlpD
VPLAARAARGALAAPAAVLLLLAVACVVPRRTREPVHASTAAAPARPRSALGDLDYLRTRRLMVPVDGISPSQVPDSYDARRGGGRRHNALDILAPRGTPVLAADAGRILRLSENSAGGLTIYAVDAEERFVYYYAHLDRYRARLREGEAIEQGDVIGYVGTTGNAPRNTPHLHFQVMRYEDKRRWWDGTPVNPHLFLALEGRRARE